MPGDSQRESGRFDSQKKIIVMTCQRFARIASNLRFAIFWRPKARFAKKGFSSGTLKRFVRIGPSKCQNPECTIVSCVRVLQNSFCLSIAPALPKLDTATEHVKMKTCLSVGLPTRGSVQGELNVHRIVVTVLCRLSPPLSQTGICRFPVPEIPLFLWEVLLFTQNLEHESTVFPREEMGGRT